MWCVVIKHQHLHGGGWHQGMCQPLPIPVPLTKGGGLGQCLSTACSKWYCGVRAQHLWVMSRPLTIRHGCVVSAVS